MSQFLFMGADLVEDAASGVPVFDGGVPPSGTNYALFPMSGSRSVGPGTDLPHPIFMTIDQAHRWWWRRRMLHVDWTADFNGFTIGGAMDIVRVLGGSGATALTDELDLMVYSNNRFVGTDEQSVPGHVRTSTVTIQEFYWSPGPIVSYYWDDTDSFVIPRFTVFMDITWDDGTEYGVNFSSEIDDGQGGFVIVDSDVFFFGGGSGSSTGNPITGSITITTPALDGYFPYLDGGGLNPRVNKDTGDPT